MGRTGVSLSEVARQSGVSTTTASMVLSNRWREFRIAPTTRDAVLAVADELGYTPRRVTRARQADRSRLWALFAPSDFDLGPTSEFYRGVNAFVQENALDIETIVFPFTRGSLHEKAEWIDGGFAAGAIMLGLGEEDVAFLEGRKIDIPIVLINRVAKNWPSVMTDDYAVGNMVAQHFARRGLTRAAMVIPSLSTRSQSLRIVGFEDNARTFAALVDGSVPQAKGSNDIDGGRAAVEQLVPLLAPSTGVFVLNDGMIGGVMHALQDAGWAVPDDIEVVSYGNSTVNSLLRPSVTSVVTPITEMARDAARALRDAEPSEGRGTATTLVDVNLALRESSPAPKV